MKYFLFLIVSLAHAEYRAFWLEIKPLSGDPQRVKSTLDPDQYPGYFPVPQGAQVKYTETWMCKGRTNGQEICKSPLEIKAEKEAEQQGDTFALPTSGQSPERKPAAK